MKRQARRNTGWRLPSATAWGLKLFSCITLILGSVGTIILETGIINVGQYTTEELNSLLENNSVLMGQVGAAVVLNFIGGLALPIIAFLLTEGFLKTGDYKKYLLTVLLFSVLSEIPYDFAMTGSVFDWSSQNPMFSTALCLIMMYFFKMTERWGTLTSGALKLLITLCAIVWIVMLRFSYGLSMILLTAVFYCFRNRSGIKMFLGFIVTLFCAFMGQGSYIGALSLYGVYCYNGVRELKCSKYVFYAIYPIQLLVLGAVTWFGIR